MVCANEFKGLVLTDTEGRWGGYAPPTVGMRTPWGPSGGLYPQILLKGCKFKPIKLAWP